MDLTCVVRRHVKVLSRRKCNFSDAVFNPPQFVDIFPDPQLTSLFTIARSKEIGVQCQACDVSALNINTDCATTKTHGVFHKEGGLYIWPRDVNPLEADQTARYRKKIEKDEAYSRSLLSYNLDMQTPDPNPLRTLHLLKDPSPIKRAVTERAVQPEIILRSMSQLRSVSFNPRDQHILAGGSIYGAVGIWDVRKSQGPVECVPIGVGQSESVTSLIWSNSKAGGEFFSASGDGQVLWWDMRKLNAPIDALLLDPSSILRSESALSARLLVWSIAMNCNRRARTTAERIMCQYEAHLGPVHGLHRQSTPTTAQNLFDRWGLDHECLDRGHSRFAHFNFKESKCPVTGRSVESHTAVRHIHCCNRR
ncbi:dynein intermediate chain 3, ciliary-like [Daphnia pulicaria]|uniref:dynein intermediate chain 3, ciliary-like n=1 Tax=Daphnia pulicaria TaxID=35523 RepID=UPI001EECBFDB|nr:dynein intermediate chain 3, ciliary-like [Daphnia pulicaria]